MHLSKELQKQLDRLNSSVQLASTTDCTYPDRYAFYNNQGRSFRTEFASTNNEFSIVLFEKTSELDYENCFARGLFYDIERVAMVIDLWGDTQKSITEIKEHFDELELFEDFEFTNASNDIEKAWRKVKNMFFNDTEFWKFSEWKDRYVELLGEAKKHQAFQNYFPFTSHYWLRFSIDKQMKETWTLDTYIIPTMYSDEIPTTVGKFYVSYNHYLISGDSTKQTWRVYDYVKECPVDMFLYFIDDAFAVTDLNKDGKAEVWIMYKVSCQGDVSPVPMKIIMYQDNKKYAVRGTTRTKISATDYEGGEYTFDESFKNAPVEFRQHAEKLWKQYKAETWGH